MRRHERPERPRTGKKRAGRFLGAAPAALPFFESVVSGILLRAFAMLGEPGHPPGGAIEMILAVTVGGRAVTDRTDIGRHRAVAGRSTLAAPGRVRARRVDRGGAAVRDGADGFALRDVEGTFSPALLIALRLPRSAYGVAAPTGAASGHHAAGIALSCSARNASSRASSQISMPSSVALSSLEPASAPATTKAVFFETLPATLAPSASSRARA